MLTVGDLIELDENSIALVRKIEGLNALLVDAMGSIGSVGVNDAYPVVANVTTMWPYVNLPTKLGSIRRVESDGIELNPLEHWVKLDYGFSGPLYLNPELGLGFRDRLVVESDRNTRYPINVPRDFSSNSDRMKRAKENKKRAEAKRPKGIFDIIKNGDD
jgi:hypothetical protein